MKKLLLFLFILLAGFTSRAQWITQVTHFPIDAVGIHYMHAVDENVVWAMGYDGLGPFEYLKNFTRTTDGGNTWQAGIIPGYAIYGVAMVYGIDGLTAWVPIYDTVSNGGKLLKTTDGGVTWTEKNTTAFAAPDGFPDIVHFFNATDGICIGDPNGGYFEIYTTTDGGDTWIRTPQANIPAQLSSEWGVIGYYAAIGDNIWFGTNKSRVYKTTDKRLTWTVSTVVTGATFIDVDFINANHGIAHDRGANSTGAMYETLDGGTTWTPIAISGPHYTYDFSWVPGTTQACISTAVTSAASGVSFSLDGGHSWTDFNGTANAYQFMATDWVNPTTGWVGGYYRPQDTVSFPGMFKYNGDPVGVFQIDPKEGGISIYPNPGNGQFNLVVVGFENKDVAVNIFNALGQNVYTGQLRQNLISYNQPIDLSGLARGTYMAVVNCGKKVMNKKLVIR